MTTNSDTLNYFQQAGAVLGRKDFFDRLRLSPVGIAIGMAMHPMFDDNNPTMSVNTEYVMNLSLDLRLDNNDGLLSKNLPVSTVELYSLNDELQKTIELPRSADDSEMITLHLTQQIAGARRSDAINHCPAFLYLGEQGSGARNAKWFKGVGELVADYGRDTDFIIKSGHSVIVQPTPAPTDTPTEVVPMTPAAPLVPSVTVQQVEESRRDRQDVMNALIGTFQKTNRLVISMTLDELRLDEFLLAQAEYIVNQHTEGKYTLEEYIALKISGLTSSILQSLES